MNGTPTNTGEYHTTSTTGTYYHGYGTRTPKPRKPYNTKNRRNLGSLNEQEGNHE